MTINCSLNYKFNTWKFQAQTRGEHVVYRNCFWQPEQFLYTTCSPYVLQKEELLTKIYQYKRTFQIFYQILMQNRQWKVLWNCYPNAPRLDFWWTWLMAGIALYMSINQNFKCDLKKVLATLYGSFARVSYCRIAYHDYFVLLLSAIVFHDKF